jgi:hypothetical protein
MIRRKNTKKPKKNQISNIKKQKTLISENQLVRTILENQ